MRYVIYGAGGVGGTIGARLHQQGHDVVLIARGEHLEALQTTGLRFISPDGPVTLSLPSVGSPEEVAWRGDEAVMLTMKTQHTVEALESLAAVAPDVPVVCAQNGVANERFAAERFAAVTAMVVWLPAVHMAPGEVVTHARGRGGVLDCGGYPSGEGPHDAQIARDLTAAGFSARVDPQVMRLKYAKLLANLLNALQATVGRQDTRSLLARALREEALACYAAAGIDVASKEEVRARHDGLYEMVSIEGYPRSGGSTWQSVARGTGNVETEYLNGEICRLGQIYGVPTVVNQAVVNVMAAALKARTPVAQVPMTVLDDEIEKLRETTG